jgi:Na+/proline symporter
MIATVMSTVESYLFVAATSVGFDLPLAWRTWRAARRGRGEGAVEAALEERRSRHRRSTRLGLVVATLATVALSLTTDSVIQLWKMIGSIVTPALLLPLVGGFFPRVRAGRRATLASMVGSAGLAVTWIALGWRGEGLEAAYPLGLEPIFPALALSLLIHLPALLRPRRGRLSSPDR